MASLFNLESLAPLAQPVDFDMFANMSTDELSCAIARACESLSLAEKLGEIRGLLIDGNTKAAALTVFGATGDLAAINEAFGVDLSTMPTDEIAAVFEKKETEIYAKLCDELGVLEPGKEELSLIGIYVVAFAIGIIINLIIRLVMRIVASIKRQADKLRIVLGEIKSGVKTIDERSMKKSYVIPSKRSLEKITGSINTTGKLLVEALSSIDGAPVKLNEIAASFRAWGVVVDTTTGDLTWAKGFEMVAGPLGVLGYTEKDVVVFGEKTYAAAKFAISLEPRFKAIAKVVAAAKAKAKDEYRMSEQSPEDKEKLRVAKADAKRAAKVLVKCTKFYYRYVQTLTGVVTRFLTSAAMVVDKD